MVFVKLLSIGGVTMADKMSAHLNVCWRKNDTVSLYGFKMFQFSETVCGNLYTFFSCVFFSNVSIYPLLSVQFNVLILCNFV